MECKGRFSISSAASAGDLIETLWNVKKKKLLAIANFVSRFNRDIVECKVLLPPSLPRYLLRFNRDIVECKGISFTSVFQTHHRFNRDIVECKDASANPVTVGGLWDLIETLWNVKILPARPSPLPS